MKLVPSEGTTAPRRRPVAAYCLLLGSLGYFLWVVHVGWDHPILEDHGFRQTQTAISTEYMVGRPPTLAYETPVLGPPWVLPFEFPLYQWLVAGTVTVLHTPLEPTGRFVSLLFFLAGLIPAAQILRMLGFSHENRLLIVSLILISPFYVFWSRAFLMESTALFASLCFLALAMALVQRPRWQVALAAVMMGSLAALVKITTFGPFLLAVLLCALASRLRSTADTLPRPGLKRQALWLLPVVLIPLAVGQWWTQFADVQRQANQFGPWLTTRALTSWIYGTTSQRLSSETWSVIFGRFGLMIGHLALGLVSLVGLWWAGRRWLEAGACVLLAVVAPLVFTNLHFVHEYYAYANGLFFIGAVGIGLAALNERGGVHRRFAHFLLATFILVAAFRYQQYYYPKQSMSHYPVVEIGKAVERLTQPDEVLIVVGCDWSPEIPFYSHRRALMIPQWPAISPRHIPEYVQSLHDHRVGALLIRETTGLPLEQETLQSVLHTVRLERTPRSLGEGYMIYTMSDRP